MTVDLEAHELRVKTRPDFESGDPALRLVDLFAGCGGLTLGVAQAAHGLGMRLDVRLAVDLDAAPLAVYRANFPKAHVRRSDVQTVFPGELGSPLASTEALIALRLGDVDLLVGGPPCQGHSDLNNHTRRNDPKNQLYTRMARAAEVLRPRVVLIENVPAVLRDKSGVVGTVRAHLEKIGYSVADAVILLHDLGVAQRRRRHVMLAISRGVVSPRSVLEAIAGSGNPMRRDLRWAIGDLVNIENPRPYDLPPGASGENQRRMEYLDRNGLLDLPNSERPKCHQGEHSYRAMYGRLSWAEPAQTITSGFGSIGQGRYMHPGEVRALTPHEAARIQGFPDHFDFGSARPRAALATMIGNSVPPQLTRRIIMVLKKLDITDRLFEIGQSQLIDNTIVPISCA